MTSSSSIAIALFSLTTLVAAGARAATSPALARYPKLTPPAGDAKIVVAFVLTEGATMIDFTGPWEVFQDVGGDDGPNPFQLYTVGVTRDAIRASAGMKIIPDYTFDDAPLPQVVVVPAQRGDPRMSDWLRTVSKQVDVLMSVCTGAFHLAGAGLLDGKRATTHHDFYDQFAHRFPKTTLVRSSRFVQSDAKIYTAGGLTSGIDLALHIVAEYYGKEAATKTAQYMEYEGKRWME